MYITKKKRLAENTLPLAFGIYGCGTEFIVSNFSVRAFTILIVYVQSKNCLKNSNISYIYIFRYKKITIFLKFSSKYTS